MRLYERSTLLSLFEFLSEENIMLMLTPSRNNTNLPLLVPPPSHLPLSSHYRHPSAATAAMTQRKWAATPAANSAGTKKSVSKINNQIIVRTGSCSADAYEQGWSQAVRELSAVDSTWMLWNVAWQLQYGGKADRWHCGGTWTLSAADPDAAQLTIKDN